MVKPDVTIIKEALVQVIFDCVKRTPLNCSWTLENAGESPKLY